MAADTGSDRARRSLLGQHRLPKRMRDFRAGDVVVGTPGSTPMADELAALQIVDFAGLEVIRTIGREQFHVHGIRTGAADAISAERAVFGHFTGSEMHLATDTGSQWVPAADRCVVFGLRRDDGAADLALSDGGIEITGSAGGIRNLGGERPQRKGCGFTQSKM